jgi:hypothetical protein
MGVCATPILAGFSLIQQTRHFLKSRVSGRKPRIFQGRANERLTCQRADRANQGTSPSELTRHGLMRGRMPRGRFSPWERILKPHCDLRSIPTSSPAIAKACGIHACARLPMPPPGLPIGHRGIVLGPLLRRDMRIAALVRRPPERVLDVLISRPRGCSNRGLEISCS